MKSTPLTLSRTLVVAALTLIASTTADAQDTLRTVVIRAATILDGRGGRITHGAVILRGDHIVDVVQGAAADGAA